MPNTTKNPTAAALIIGNEILSGRTPDANLNVIARRLNDIGIPLKEARIVADIETEIIENLNALRQKYTYVFTTGGIGPTHDDITAQSIATAFGVEVILNENIAKMLRKTRPNMPDASLKMATYPQGAQLIPTPQPVPPAFYIGNVYALAGVPKIMQIMLEGALPLLQKGDEIHTKSIDAMVTESAVSAPFEDIQNQFPHLDLGSYPFKTGNKYATSLVIRGTNKKDVETAFAEIEKMLHKLQAEVR